ncbi:MAG: VIT family protein [Maritimibacter sp.]
MNEHFQFDEHHMAHRVGWLRAAVMGANDGIVSTGSLIVGVAAAASSQSAVLVAGIAGLVAGAMSMAAGEYVSVSSQSDTERADLEKEKAALRDRPEEELAELAAIYVERGLEKDLAQEVAKQLTAKDALAAHARDEIGISHTITALVPMSLAIPSVTAASLVSLAALGALSAQAGGAPVLTAVARVTLWGALAMAATAAIGALFGATVV